MKRQFFAFVLALIMVISIPLAASAEWTIDCAGLGSAKSGALTLTAEPQTWTFTSTSKEGMNEFFHSAALEVWSGTTWEATIRSDSYGWNGAGGLDSFNPKNYPADWAVWVEDNHAGVTCTVTAQVVDGADADYAVVGFSNNGVANVYKVPVTDVNAAVIYLTGEQCVLTDLQSGGSAISLSDAVASIPTPPAEDEVPGWSLAITGFMTKKSEGFSVTTSPKSWTFKSVSNGPENYDNPVVLVTSAGVEELIIRADCFAVSEEFTWGSISQDAFGGKNYPADWAAWNALNDAGADNVVTAQVVDGMDADYLIVGFTNAGVTNIYKVPVNDINDVTLYLTGEDCVLSDLATSSSALIDISAAVASVATEDNNPPAWEVVCTTLGAARSEGLPLTKEPQTWTFTSTTNADAADNWDTAAIDINTAAAWELTVRSDSFAASEEFPWGTAGQNSYSAKQYPADWNEWLAANKAGAECVVTAQVVGNYIIVAFQNAGVTNTYVVRTTSPSTAMLYLTGEECVLTDLAVSEDHLDISDAVAEMSQPSDPDNADTGDHAMILPMIILMISSLCALVVIFKRQFAR